MKYMILCLLMLFTVSTSFANESIVLNGSPKMKISEGGLSRYAEKLNSEQSAKAKCIISTSGNKFYWTSRNGTELMRIDGGGAYITYQAINGAGYVRVIKPLYIDTFRKTGNSSDDAPELYFDYVEHLLIGLKAITYYGEMSK